MRRKIVAAPAGGLNHVLSQFEERTRHLYEGSMPGGDPNSIVETESISFQVVQKTGYETPVSSPRRKINRAQQDANLESRMETLKSLLPQAVVQRFFLQDTQNIQIVIACFETPAIMYCLISKTEFEGVISQLENIQTEHPLLYKRLAAFQQLEDEKKIEKLSIAQHILATSSAQGASGILKMIEDFNQTQESILQSFSPLRMVKLLKSRTPSKPNPND